MKYFWILIIFSLLAMGCSNTAPQAMTPTPNVGNSPQQIVTPPPTIEKANSAYVGKILAGNKTLYITFNTEDYQKATSDGKVILLYFYSDNNPTSKAEELTVFDAFNKMESIKMIGFKVHYDDPSTTDVETQLATTLGVKSAHTKIILKDGKVMWQYSSSLNADTYITQMSRFLT